VRVPLQWVQDVKQYLSCPGRGAAFFTLLRRAGTQALQVRSDGPRISSAPHSVSKTRVNALVALRCIRGTHSSSYGLTDYLPPSPGHAFIAAAAMPFNSADVAPSRAWIAMPWKTPR
jgi:hypothetical protein